VILALIPLSLFAGEYDAQIAVMDKVTGIMNEFADQIEDASSPKEYANACDRLADGMEEYGPRLMEIAKNHPEWADNPPAEMQESMSSHMIASGRYEKALSGLVQASQQGSVRHVSLSRRCLSLFRICFTVIPSKCETLMNPEADMQKEITLSEFADELTVRLQKNKTVDCCKEELLRLAGILKEKLPQEKILVTWKED
jgi:hypothetical protein